MNDLASNDPLSAAAAQQWLDRAVRFAARQKGAAPALMYAEVNWEHMFLKILWKKRSRNPERSGDDH